MYCTAAIPLLRFWVLENLYGISYLFPGDFCFQVKDKSFSIFTRSLRALTFQFCCGSFTIKLSRKAITFVHLVCVLSFIIWGVYFVISSGVYNRRFFHASWHAACVQCRLHRSFYAFTSQHLSAWTFGAGCARLKGVIVLSQANICRLEYICAGCTSKSLRVSQSVSKCLTSVSKCHILKETVVCLELSRVLFILINWVSSLLDCCCCSLKNTSKYGDLYWTFPFKDWISWQFRENKGCLIAL